MELEEPEDEGLYVVGARTRVVSIEVRSRSVSKCGLVTSSIDARVERLDSIHSSEGSKILPFPDSVLLVLVGVPASAKTLSQKALDPRGTGSLDMRESS